MPREGETHSPSGIDTGSHCAPEGLILPLPMLLPVTLMKHNGQPQKKKGLAVEVGAGCWKGGGRG